MKLNTQQIFAAARGAVRYEETDRGLVLHRFTRQQREIYRLYAASLSAGDWKNSVNGFYRNTASSAGIKPADTEVRFGKEISAACRAVQKRERSQMVLKLPQLFLPQCVCR